MDEIQKLINEIAVRKQNLQFSHSSKKDLFEFWNNKHIQLNEKVEEYKKCFTTQESAAEKLDKIHNRLCSLMSPTIPMEYVLKDLEQLRNEIVQLDHFVGVPPDAPVIQVGDLNYIFRVVKRGEKWEDKDTTIHNLKQQCKNGDDQITELTDQMKDKDRFVHNLTHEMEDLKRRLNMYSQSRYLINSELQPPYSNVVPQLQTTCTPSYQHDQPGEYQDFDQYSVGDNCTNQGSTQLQTDNTRLKNELDQSKKRIQTLEGEAQIRKEELEQIKADQERNPGKPVYNFYGPSLNVMNYGSQDNALQFGDHNRWLKV